MEEFEKIDWLPNVEDIIDDKFVDEERIKNESVMYSLLNGTFRDPFANLRTANYTPYKAQEPKRIYKKKKNKEGNKGGNKGVNKEGNKEGNNEGKYEGNNEGNNVGNSEGNNEGIVKRQRGRPKKKIN